MNSFRLLEELFLNVFYEKKNITKEPFNALQKLTLKKLFLGNFPLSQKYIFTCVHTSVLQNKQKKGQLN